ncbi:MAG: hypothetical protein VCC00_13090 [Deltaproteobacteria bacterium]
MQRRMQSRLARWLALGLGLLALLVSGYGLVRHNNWYLASDQAAFLTIARDMQTGTVFHDTAIFTDTVVGRADWKRYDAFQQTYFLQQDKLYSRYPPGFPAMLAVAGAVAGERGEHWLNPLLYLATLLVLAGLLYTLLRGQDRALAAGTAVLAMWLVLLVPTGVHLWGITVARDLPAHFLGLLGLVFAVRNRPILSGLTIGFALVVRPDAILYGLPVAAIVLVSRPPLSRILFWVVALGVGASPLLAYNFVTLGHPLSFTQGGEFRDLLGWLQPPSAHAAPAGSVAVPSGGGFRLANLRTTLPGNLIVLGRAFGSLLLFTGAGMVWSLRRRPLVAAALLPYPLAAVVFYSCWTHPDARYLAGASLCLIGLTSVGVVTASRALQSDRAWRHSRWLALLVAALLVAWQMAAGQGTVAWAPGGTFVVVVAGSACVASVAHLLRNQGAVTMVAPALALAILALLRLFSGTPSWGSFRAPQAHQAQALVAQYIPPGSLVLASPSLGRPAENLRVYSGVEAFYPAEFSLFDKTAEDAIVVALASGRRVFRLVDARARIAPDSMPNIARIERVLLLPPQRALEIYADPRRAPRGVALYEVVATEARRHQLRQYLALPEPGAPAAE